ncbi:P-loop containing nucleoside triphosphate hydrolase protein, partial [Rhodofomes roseus]
MPVASRILQPPPIHCQSSNLKFDDALTIARAAAHKSRGYDSEGTRQKIKELSVEAFGGKEPYGWQVDVCEAILLGLDCIVIAGTGAGKTVPFAMPLLLDETKKKLVVVISPLNELERDQAERFRTMGLTATAINKEEYSDRLHKVRSSEIHTYRMLLTGPEMALEHKRFSKLLRSPSFAKNIAAIVIDEAHCISQWGDSFRKKYAELGRLRALVPMSVPFLATSATLPPAALADVQAKLSFHLNSTFFVNLGNDRTNITPLVVQMKGGAGDLAALDFAVREALAGDPLVKTLIFFNTRELAMRACHHLKTLLPDAYKGKIDFLHALRGDDTKREVMQRFRNDELSILCATEAAGMGLDISNIRRVIQFMVPTSLSQWFQRYGRAGRDGLPAVAILLVEQSVFKKVKPRGSTKDSVDNNDTKVFQKQVECGLRTWLEAPDCRRTVANAYFNNPRNERVLTVPCCDVCLSRRSEDPEAMLSEAEDNMLKLLKSIRLRETGDRLVESAVKIEESEPGLAGAATGKRPAARQKERFKYVYNAALAWRRLCWRRDYSICVWGPEALLSDKTASKIVRATAIQTLGDLTTSVPEWCFAKKHGEELLQTILSADE